MNLPDGVFGSISGTTLTISGIALSSANSPYNFTINTSGSCNGESATATGTIVVLPSPSPTFAVPTSICFGQQAPVLPTTSLNGIEGTWSPATVSNTATGTYTFTANPGQCVSSSSLQVTIVVTNPATPTFNPIPAICQGSVPPVLPTTSLNGIVGTWSPATVSTTATGTYTFTPNAGQCVNATPVQVTVVVNPSPAPTFAPIANTICANTIPPVLPTTSLNGITGTWSPAVVSNTASGTYTFTPNPGQCTATATVQIAITVVPVLTPEFAPIAPLCAGSAPPVLPATSLNGVVGSWSPSVVSNTATGVYTFTPNPGQCVSVSNVQVTITVNNVVTPAFAPIPPICAGQAPPVLPTTSSNGITGTCSPSVVSNTASGIYTFTPGPGQCVTTSSVQIQVTVKPVITPQFQAIAPLCAGSAAPVLPTTSLNGITGTWSPPLVNSQSSGIYTFTPNPSDNFCYNPVTVNITVNPRQNPGFQNLELCRNQTNFSLNTTSPNGILGTWSPSVIDFDNGGSYTFTPNPGQCATPQAITVTIKENEILNFDLRVSEPFEDSPTITIIPLSQGNYLYQLDAGTPQVSNIFRDVSRGFHTVRIIDADGCSDDVVFEDVLIIDYPKFFTPNGDGINDTWNINSLFFQRNSKIYIFDRYGKLLTQIFPFRNGWDGTYNNARMKSDDYWFVVDYVYNNQPRQFKAHFSLKR
ncbi:T9SS type B sorting domain-containing protein [Flavobacterium cyanobacteriorum]|uniref:T9SS type B sorting domain-containing protein n=1 Tax=Flavobacterium cyanobacteriorum TaxID=2022802 RepID=UPI0013FD3105|nr:T9SS type B sorting domain-containing protein [Flavobacterium cyanobacteriorum]